jgi:hypothetical protein
MLQSLAPMLSEFLRQHTGGYGFTFGSDMNVANAQLAREFMAQVNNARTAGARADQGQVTDVLRGMAVMIGHDFTRHPLTGRPVFSDETNASIKTLSGDLTGMLPMLAAMFPDTVDRLFPRGSMAVAGGVMAQAGRFTIDSATGRPIADDPEYASRVLSHSF